MTPRVKVRTLNPLSCDMYCNAHGFATRKKPREIKGSQKLIQ